MLRGIIRRPSVSAPKSGKVNTLTKLRVSAPAAAGSTAQMNSAAASALRLRAAPTLPHRRPYASLDESPSAYL